MNDCIPKKAMDVITFPFPVLKYALFVKGPIYHILNIYWSILESFKCFGEINNMQLHMPILHKYSLYHFVVIVYVESNNFRPENIFYIWFNILSQHNWPPYAQADCRQNQNVTSN